MELEDIKQEIRQIGAIAVLKRVAQTLADVGISDVEPLSAHLAIELEELILYNEAPNATQHETIADTVHDFMFSAQ